MVRLFGSPPVAPAKSRIVELAVGRRANLLWIARTLPDAECLGIDPVADGIREAQKFSRDAQLNNVCFQACDLLDRDFGDERFDHIINHGLFTGVPEAVQERILWICADHLATNGTVFISYNTLLGCGIRQSLRELFLLELAGMLQEDLQSSQKQLERIQAGLAKLKEAMPGV